MKAILLLCCVVFALVSAKQINPYIIHLTPKFLSKVQHIIQKCENEFKPPPNAVKNMLAGLAEDEVSLSFMYCYLLEAGFLTKDGHLEINNIAVFIKPNDLKEKFVKAMEECNKLNGEDPRETLRVVADCFYNNSPVTFVP